MRLDYLSIDECGAHDEGVLFLGFSERCRYVVILGLITNSVDASRSKDLAAAAREAFPSSIFKNLWAKRKQRLVYSPLDAIDLGK